MSVAYHIHDEPTGSRSAVLVLNPFWPLIAMMFSGAWLGAALFALNAWFLRGPTWGREIVLALAILLGAPVILLLLALAGRGGLLPGSAFDYALLLIVGWKLGVSYWIFFLQQNAYALFEYFGGRVEGRAQALPLGAVLVFAGTYIKTPVLNAFESPFWKVMVG